jgi:hypothetical protein
MDRRSFSAFVLTNVLGACGGTLPPQAATRASARASARAPRIVQGDLEIVNRDSLEEFAEVEIVTGTLSIVGNTRLKNLDGLERLRVAGELVISENVGLRSIDAIARLEHSRSITVVCNPRLEDLRGLDSLRRLDRLVVGDNGIFFTRGLDALVEVGDLVVSKNRRLLSLRGLQRLTTVTNVTIEGNPRLIAESGLLPKLELVRGKLAIRHNAGLDERAVCALVTRMEQQAALASR